MNAVIRSSIIGFIGLSAGCGWFTNVPAQLKVKSITPSSIRIDYKPPAANSALLYTAEVPASTLVITGEAGSIGATFTAATIEALDSASAPDAKGQLKRVGDIANQYLDINLRVESSASQNTVGTGQFDLSSAVNRQVLDYGFKRTSGSLSLRVTLTGQDDAKFPLTLVTNVPVVFTGHSQ